MRLLLLRQKICNFITYAYIAQFPLKQENALGLSAIFSMMIKDMSVNRFMIFYYSEIQDFSAYPEILTTLPYCTLPNNKFDTYNILWYN